MNTRKKLIEVALPLDAINKACVEDKNRKTGHIRNLHKWFAPMPLPAWRAVLFASLVDDPGNDEPDDQAAVSRSKLFEIIEGLLPITIAHNSPALAAARRILATASKGRLPTIVDPFCGGGSTLVEAQRLGLPSFGSDLNPIPVLITKVLTEFPPKIAHRPPINPNDARRKGVVGGAPLVGFLTDVEHYGDIVRERCWTRLSSHYPKTSRGATVISWRWARTVASPDPSARGAHTPLVSNWWLTKRKGASFWIEPISSNGAIKYEIRRAGTPPPATTGRGGAKCLLSGTTIPLPYIRSEGKRGRLGVQLLATIADNGSNRSYEPATEDQTNAARNAKPKSPPLVELPPQALGFRVQEYGLKLFDDLFTSRQLLCMETFCEEVAGVREEIIRDFHSSLDNASRERVSRTTAVEYADAIVAVLSLCVGKLAQSNNAFVRWYIDARNGASQALPAFDRHAMPMIWDFAEVNPFGGSVGDWQNQVATALRAFQLVEPGGPPARVEQIDARDIASVGITDPVVATDPPYFGNIGYADLADFFYVWVRRALGSSQKQLFSTIVTPKEAELIATPFRHNGDRAAAKAYFQKGFEQVFSCVAQIQKTDIPISIVYAFKQEEEGDSGEASTGWEAMLEGLIRSKLSIVATWPLRTSRATRMIGLGTNALASAIVILCRPREVNLETASRRQFVDTLRVELPPAMKALQQGNIAPVDLAQAAIGPGMAVFSRFANVLDAEGKPLRVKDALRLINNVLDELLAEQETDFDPDTRWAIAWFEQYGFEEGEFGTAETLSKAKNTSVNGIVEAGIARSKAGKVRLLKPNQLDGEWDPQTDSRLTNWEMVHRLIGALESKGETAAAEIGAKLGTKAESARDLCYRLYILCERKKRAAEALSYNGLVQSWPEIMRLAKEQAGVVPVQQELV
jgi:putative DNA methylase